MTRLTSDATPAGTIHSLILSTQVFRAEEQLFTQAWSAPVLLTSSSRSKMVSFMPVSRRAKRCSCVSCRSDFGTSGRYYFVEMMSSVSLSKACKPWKSSQRSQVTCMRLTASAAPSTWQPQRQSGMVVHRPVSSASRDFWPDFQM